MNIEALKSNVKEKLEIEGGEKDVIISDMLYAVLAYCNIPISDEHIPEELEPFIRKKVKGIIDYEVAMGVGYIKEIQSIKEGDASITWAQTDGNTKESIYGVNSTDKKMLNRFRRLHK